MNKIILKEELHSSKWLKLVEITYKDHNGVDRKWDSTERLNCLGAVIIVATLKPSNRIVIIKQFRPPTGKYLIEFPAGLIDEGFTVEETAMKELLEETGYTGIIKATRPAVYNSPGLTGESVHIAVMEIDETLEENIDVIPQLESTEDIETILVKKDNLRNKLDELSHKGFGIDAKLDFFAINI